MNSPASFAAVATCAVSLAMISPSAGADGYDPRARVLIQSILNAAPAEPRPPKSFVYAMTDPVRHFGSRRRAKPERTIEHDGPDNARVRALSIRAALKEGRFSLVTPLERGDALDQLPTYRKLKQRCAHLPNAVKLSQTTGNGKKKFVETPVRIDPNRNLTKAERRNLKRIWFRPGMQKAIDYEHLYFERTIYTARTGFALYRIQNNNNRELYVLRAAKYQSGDTVRGFGASHLEYPGRLEGLFSLFSGDDCRYWGSMPFGRYSRPELHVDPDVKAEMESNSSYLHAQVAELALIDGRPYPIFSFGFVESSVLKAQETVTRVWDVQFTQKFKDGYVHEFGG